MLLSFNKCLISALTACTYLSVSRVNAIGEKLELLSHLNFGQNCSVCHRSFEPPYEKTNNLHMRKQRRRSASR